ncbi:MAG: DUF3592 domain-containing protein [Clostridia bacterium]|nr:DUF3592 domain-containing protein [Clostridia bacterium]
MQINIEATIIIIASLAVCIMIYYAIRKATDRKRQLLALGVSCAMIPVCLLVGVVCNKQKLIVSGFLLPMGVVILLSVVFVLVRYKGCSSQVEAKYTGMERVSSYKGVEYYAPVFSYTYNGKAYSSRSLFTHSKRSITKAFSVGDEYTIYINPKIPSESVHKKKVPCSMIVAVCSSICFIVLGVVLLLI